MNIYNMFILDNSYQIWNNYSIQFRPYPGGMVS